MCFGTVNPVVWRTIVLGLAKSNIKTNWILTIPFCDVPVATKLTFSAQDSHCFLTMRFLHVVARVQFFVQNWHVQFLTRFPNGF